MCFKLIEAGGREMEVGQRPELVALGPATGSRCNRWKNTS